MISLTHLYAEFSPVSPGEYSAGGIADEALQDAQLTGFESGYKAGWEDCINSKGSENEQLTADLVQSVQDMSFTYHEAYAKLSARMQPLMSRFVTSVLPTFAQEGLHSQLVEQIGKLIDSQLSNSVELVVPPNRRAGIEEVLQAQVGVPFIITEESSLGEGQTYLRVNQQEREINIDAILSELQAAIDAFFHTPEKEFNHG